VKEYRDRAKEKKKRQSRKPKPIGKNDEGRLTLLKDELSETAGPRRPKAKRLIGVRIENSKKGADGILEPGGKLR